MSPKVTLFAAIGDDRDGGYAHGSVAEPGLEDCPQHGSCPEPCSTITICESVLSKGALSVLSKWDLEKNH